MVYCRGCGKEIHESAVTCPHCGAPQRINKISKSAMSDTIPEGVKGWSWGAFLLNFIWAIGNKTWIGLLAFIPFLGWIMAFVLGFKGREWAWKNKEWDSVEHFNRVQKKWSYWGVVILIIELVVGIAAAVAIPAYQDYQHRADGVVNAKLQAQFEADQKQADDARIADEAKRQAEAAVTQQQENTVSTIEINLLANPELSDEGISLTTDKGTFNMYSVNAPDQVRAAFANAKTGECLLLETANGFNFTDASGIRNVGLCK